MSLNLEGSKFGKIEVISRHSVANKKVRWNVRCLECGKSYDLATDTIKKNVHGCSGCTRLNAPKGSESIYWRGGRHISSIFLSNVKRGARKRGIEVTVEIDDLDAVWEMQEGKCAYTGRQLTLSGDDCTASLDRRDSSKGYVSFNIQFVHKTVNVMKWALPEQEFLDFVADIYRYSVDGENKWS